MTLFILHVFKLRNVFVSRGRFVKKSIFATKRNPTYVVRFFCRAPRALFLGSGACHLIYIYIYIYMSDSVLLLSRISSQNDQKRPRATKTLRILGLFWVCGGPDGAYGAYGGRGIFCGQKWGGAKIKK